MTLDYISTVGLLLLTLVMTYMVGVWLGMAVIPLAVAFGLLGTVIILVTALGKWLFKEKA